MNNKSNRVTLNREDHTISVTIEEKDTHIVIRYDDGVEIEYPRNVIKRSEPANTYSDSRQRSAFLNMERTYTRAENYAASYS